MDGCTSEADKVTVRKDLAQNQVSLTVNRLTSNDSAIYICGIAFPSSQDPRAKQAGDGTVLVVRGQSVMAVLWYIAFAQPIKRITQLTHRL